LLYDQAQSLAAYTITDQSDDQDADDPARPEGLQTGFHRPGKVACAVPARPNGRSCARVRRRFTAPSLGSPKGLSYRSDRKRIAWTLGDVVQWRCQSLVPPLDRPSVYHSDVLSFCRQALGTNVTTGGAPVRFNSSTWVQSAPT